VSRLNCFIQEKKRPSEKNIEYYYSRNERVEWKEYCKILIKKGNSQLIRILQNITQEKKVLNKEILQNIYQENERVVLWILIVLASARSIPQGIVSLKTKFISKII
jgi:hypothetical protein